MADGTAGLLEQADGVAGGERGAAALHPGWNPRHRLPAQGVPAGGPRSAAALPRGASVPGGAAPDGGLRGGRGARAPPAAARGALQVRQLGPPVGGAGRPVGRPVDGPAAARLRDRRGARRRAMKGSRGPLPVVLLLALFAALEAVPFYTDWLLFEEVGYSPVFLSVFGLRGSLFLVVGLPSLLFIGVNLRAAAYARPPDVFWELEEPLGLPSRVILEPLLRRALVPFTVAVAMLFGLAAS